MCMADLDAGKNLTFLFKHPRIKVIIIILIISKSHEYYNCYILNNYVLQ